MAEDKATRSAGEPSVSEALGGGASEHVETPAEGTPPIPGYVPADVGEPADENDAGLPGENLAHDLAEPEPFEVVDDEAEELDSEEPDADEDREADEPAGSQGRISEAGVGHHRSSDSDDEIDDPEQLADAEGVALAAKSTRPVKRKKAAPAPAEDAEADASDEGSSDEEEADGEDGAPVSKPARKTATATAPSRKKTTKTPSRKEAEAARPTHRRTTPLQFVRESVAELRKVVWPTGTQVQQYFLVVLIFVLFIIAFVGLLDLGLGWLLLKLLG